MACDSVEFLQLVNVGCFCFLLNVGGICIFPRLSNPPGAVSGNPAGLSLTLVSKMDSCQTSELKIGLIVDTKEWRKDGLEMLLNYKLILMLSHPTIPSVFCYVEAQSTSDQDNFPPQDQINIFPSSLEIGAGIMTVMFSLILFLIVYAKYCYRRGLVHNNQQTTNIIISSGPRSSGINKTTIESLPLFRFSALRGSREGLECAVCLSKFEDVEVLRLLPKCKHAFHIDCIDEWLGRHSSCPLCRHKISADDVDMVLYSNSLRFLTSQADVREDSNVELFVQREESRRKSSRFNIGNSFRKVEKGVVKGEKLPIREDCDGVKANDKFLHKYNHKIVMSDIVLKRRWSDLSSADLVFLNSEMLAAESSDRFSSSDSNTQENSTTQATEESGIAKIKEEMEKKWDFETMVGKLNQNGLFLSSSGATTSNPTRALNPNDRRSMSEITVHSRFKEFNVRNGGDSFVPENSAKEERLKRIWLPIAQRTVQRYADKDRKSQLPK
ncbi:E3 ubiquitin-protein ligase ATL42-like [Rhododendron vialii]|uniref:E3 ubiquitin-protein ligase ATL42-like n=1 Tax=Rhododendron vialii TaxID=182163 RepID=UPI00265E5F90|nr:E3 ubiquitin-protein ligase ATL42-like [Rhododendron vialii]